jgi:hypothetical protein
MEKGERELGTLPSMRRTLSMGKGGENDFPCLREKRGAVEGKQWQQVSMAFLGE